MDRTEQTLRRLLEACWGKAGTCDAGHYHPVLLHMLDVAAVSLCILQLPAHRGRTSLLLEVGGLKLAPESLALLVALHDLGKIAPGFQQKVPKLSAGLAHSGLCFPSRALGDHSRVGGACLPTELRAIGVQQDVAYSAAAAVTAHHGWVNSAGRLAADLRGDGTWDDLRRAAVVHLARLLPLGELPRLSSVTDAWVATLAGLTAVADWIGSDVSYFPYQPGLEANAAYLSAARQRALTALEGLGWTGWSPSTVPRAFDELFPFQPHPAQEAVVSWAPSARLLVVEAPTGSGKTESALAAVDRWTVDAQGAGLFVALPTQATSNQMVRRVAEFLSKRFPEARVNLHLAHSGAGLNRDYAALRARSVDGPGATTAGVIADEWFAARRRPLLSPFGVGTIDQALLGVLQCRHGLVRLYALSGKSVIIDEVHAYDAFMSRILHRLLQWLAALHCRVVLLSATLAPSQRRELLAAWGARHMDQAEPAMYPGLTAVSADGTAKSMPLQAHSHRRVNLDWGPPERHLAATAELVLAKVRDEGCAAWICNTVARAQAAAATLLAQGLSQSDLTVLHARIPAGRRAGLEAVLLAKLGRDGQRPARHVVVATQVIEQSLDVDFDWMASDLAPVDLLIQRAGRVWRHDRRRPAGFGSPTMLIARPEGPPAEPHFGAAQRVYDAHILLRTWLAIRDSRGWSEPNDVQRLVAAVYEECSAPAGEIAQHWHVTKRELIRHQNAQRAAASAELLPAPEQNGELLDDLALALHDDLDSGRPPGVVVKTRDIDVSVRLLCLLRTSEGHLAADSNADKIPLDRRPTSREVASLLGSAVNIGHASWAHALLRTTMPAPWSSVGALRGCRALEFDNAGRAELDGRELHLHSILGLCLGPLPAVLPPEVR